MKRVEHIADLRGILDDARAEGQTVGFVPTMGYFHDGHVSLMRAARAAHDIVVVSLFVNPLQFGANEDLSQYPRDLDRDSAMADAAGVDLLFAPGVDEMYPEAVATTVHVSGLTEMMCGAARPSHFDGVATVVTKLFSIVGPCTAYFGTKDFQQLAVVRRLARDLNLPVAVVGCPLVREPDGLAMSSRNAYLTLDERTAATVLFRALRAGIDAIVAGERDAATVRRVVANAVTVEPLVRLEYAEVRSADSLEPLDRLVAPSTVLVAVAARVGATRLIDNVTVSLIANTITSDLGVIADSNSALSPPTSRRLLAEVGPLPHPAPSAHP